MEGVRARYDALIRPLLAVQRRNGGVRLPTLVQLELERKREIDAITKAHQKAEAHEMAARDAPWRAVAAHERQAEQAALNSLARDLPRSSRRYQGAEPAGRDTADIAVW